MPKILIVDDSAFARTTLRRILKDAGYEVHEAASGLEALELMPGLNPDLVTLDLLMPEMEGGELIGHLRQIDRLTPLIVISADIQTATRDEVLAAGATAYLNKPVKDEELLALIVRLLASRGS
ncbi:MAG: PleD family two-component system response regulator [Chloroflexota bacterium]